MWLGKVKTVYIYCPDIPVGSADFMHQLPSGMGTHFHSLISLLIVPSSNIAHVIPAVGEDFIIEQCSSVV